MTGKQRHKCTFRTWTAMTAIIGLMTTSTATAYDFNETPNPVATDTSLWRSVYTPRIGWGSTDVRYAKEKPAQAMQRTMELTAWRGEHVSALAVVTTPVTLDSVTVTMGALTSGRDTLTGTTAFTRYLLTDGLAPDNTGGCGYRRSEDYDSSLVADIIDTHTRTLTLPALTTQSCWVGIDVPQDIPAGRYSGIVTVSGKGQVLERLRLCVRVKERTLPPPSQWAFHLDLWQNPYAVARYHGVQPFSAEHFEAMRPVMQRYAEAGGKVITASITHKPWNGQTYDPFESMVTWLRRADGTWLFDYTAFDRWVEFMMGLGVTAQINCYSMVPWRLSFQYFDQATNQLQFIQCRPGDAAYEEFWGTMLADFARHLKAKGWFGITHIAMDERSLPDMLATLKVIRRADPGFKVSLAGSYHSELASELDDYCITLTEEFPTDVLAARHKSGHVSTFYTCCQERQPNTFTFSAPAEAEWLAWHAAREGLDGYLRWALNSWVRDPLHDSRFTAWPAGDTYLVYPDGLTSVRMERLREGIQQYEKVRLLRQEFTERGNRRARQRLDDALAPFTFGQLHLHSASDACRHARRVLNRL